MATRQCAETKVRWRKRRIEVMCVVLLTGAGAVLVAALRQAETNSVVQTASDYPYGQVAPDIQARIDNTQVKTIRAEALEQSLNRLGTDVGAYFWPGGTMTSQPTPIILPLPTADLDEKAAVQNILSNRRFLKVMHDLSALPKKEAAVIVSRHLENGLAQYRRLLKREVEATGGCSIRWTGDPDQPPSAFGLRYKLFGLALVAANLGLKDTGGQLVEFARVAKRQYKRYLELEASQRLTTVKAYVMITQGTLYNRVVLAAGLLGTAAEGVRSGPVGKKYEASWTATRLTHFDARATPYDIHASRGFVPVDFSKGAITVRYLAGLNDSDFDEILAAVTGGKGTTPRKK